MFLVIGTIIVSFLGRWHGVKNKCAQGEYLLRLFLKGGLVGGSVSITTIGSVSYRNVRSRRFDMHSVMGLSVVDREGCNACSFSD